MPIRDIIVHIDESKNCEARISTAVDLVSDTDAHLTGVYIKPSIYLPAYVMAQVGPEVMEVHRKMVAETASKAEAAFLKSVKAAGIKGEWRLAEGPIDEIITLHARHADLAIIGQTDPDGNAEADSLDVPGHVILFSGRPVIVVPFIGKFRKLGKNVLIAWNGSREAARAVNDALPLLQMAKTVTVLVLNPQKGAGRHGDLPGADISLHLARHGVKVEAAQSFADDIEAGDMLLSRAADIGADLIVMGGYGRSRLRELVMGGVSRHLLQHMTVPVFMAH